MFFLPFGVQYTARKNRGTEYYGFGSGTGNLPGEGIYLYYYMVLSILGSCGKLTVPFYLNQTGYSSCCDPSVNKN